MQIDELMVTSVNTVNSNFSFLGGYRGYQYFVSVSFLALLLKWPLELQKKDLF